MKDIYPLTIVKDRYSGVYSGGEYTAWNMDPDDIPLDINDQDVPCGTFWSHNTIPVGVGDTPDEAIEDLSRKISPPPQLADGCDLLSLDALAWLKSVNYLQRQHEERMKLIDAARVLYPG